MLEDIFESLSPVDYAKKLINTSPDENKKIVEEIEDRISYLKDRIKRISEKEKKKDENADETLEIIKKILDYNKNAQNFFHLASKVDKGKSKSKIEESIAERVKLRKQKLNLIRKKKENINNELLNHYFDYLNPVIMFERCLKIMYLKLKRMKK